MVQSRVDTLAKVSNGKTNPPPQTFSSTSSSKRSVTKPARAEAVQFFAPFLVSEDTYNFVRELTSQDKRAMCFAFFLKHNPTDTRLQHRKYSIEDKGYMTAEMSPSAKEQVGKYDFKIGTEVRYERLLNIDKPERSIHAPPDASSSSSSTNVVAKKKRKEAPTAEADSEPLLKVVKYNAESKLTPKEQVVIMKTNLKELAKQVALYSLLLISIYFAFL